MAPVRFKGIPFYMDGKDYIVPSLSFGQFEDNTELLNRDIPADAKIGVLAKERMPVVLLAVQRNYPDVTLENLLDWIDLNTFAEIWLAVQGASGMKAVSAVKPGE